MAYLIADEVDILRSSFTHNIIQVCGSKILDSFALHPPLVKYVKALNPMMISKLCLQLFSS